jgi:hypothetical protein
VNPNLTTYSMADQIERHRVTSRPELPQTHRVRPVQGTEQPSGVAPRARLGGVVLSLIGKVRGAQPLRRSSALPLYADRRKRHCIIK